MLLLSKHCHIVVNDVDHHKVQQVFVFALTWRWDSEGRVDPPRGLLADNNGGPSWQIRQNSEGASGK